MADAGTSRRALIILGMHRSGTSAVARTCNLLGVELGSDLLGPDSANPTGYWEHRKILALDERLLADLGSSWHDVKPLPAGWPEGEAAARYRSAVAAILDESVGSTPGWGVKEPRLCRLLPAWLPVIADRGDAASFLIVVRHPAAVARSLAGRDSLPVPHGHLLWLRHLLEAEAATRGRPRAAVLYDDVLTDWQGAMAGAGARMGFTWPRPIAEAAESGDRFLRGDLRHHRGETGDSLPAWVDDIWRGIVAARGGDVRELERAADHVAGELARADEIWAPLLAGRETDFRSLRAALDSATGSLESAAAGLEERNRLIRSLKREQSESAAIIERLEQRVRRLSGRG